MKGKGGSALVYTVHELRDMVTPIAVKYGLKGVSLFGSYARGTASEESDVDLIIDTTGTPIRSLLQVAGIHEELERTLRKNVDLLTVSSLTQKQQMPSEARFRENVMRERKELYVP